MKFEINRAKVEKAFQDYSSAYDTTDAKVKLKVDHTYRVAALSDCITDSLGMTGFDKEFAWLVGMLHDIGRFEQLRRYHTFRDALSVNHAELSADILFQEKLIERFIRIKPDVSDKTAFSGKEALTGETKHVGSKVSDDNDFLSLEKAIRLHNVYQLPDDLTAREYRFATILRDADKLDILRVNVETPRRDIYDVPDDIFLHADISDAVYENILHCRNLHRNMIKTPADLLLGHISFVFGLVYPISVRLMKEQGYLETVLQFPSRNEKTRQRFIIIRDVVHKYIEKRIENKGDPNP